MLQHRARIDLAWEPDLCELHLKWDGPRYGMPVLVRPRMGQGHFKRAVADACRQRCAVTASATFPSLEAAHIRPFADGGDHAVSNGLLLRTDVPAYDDRGYLSVDADLRLRVSRRCAARAGTARSSTSVRRLTTGSRRRAAPVTALIATRWPGSSSQVQSCLTEPFSPTGTTLDPDLVQQPRRTVKRGDPASHRRGRIFSVREAIVRLVVAGSAGRANRLVGRRSPLPRGLKSSPAPE